jgi:hypothetical protein
VEATTKASQERMEAVINSIRSELEETIKNQIGDVLVSEMILIIFSV